MSDLDLYVLAELNYKKLYNDDDSIFPENWYSNKNYKLKVEIIAEAIKNNIKIEETNLYQNKFIEKVDLED